ncbi:hypothetical protein SAMN05443377_1035 [Propionibacterium cyclohexanicum]|uniref:PAP2 superfamily protein n=1 Tax=Propionibacterium cyclohexanicum TaxID=64702 RepID=A0A1H9QBG3_9ACTN|nr:hypothetical protein [Propionibacterium cyclohexanicum]SER57804.1 hypothetical protein SAMN05443377_1035 [Propionibacterium cyclohexanicum]
MTSNAAARGFAQLTSLLFHPAVTVPVGLVLIGFIAGGWRWAAASLVFGALPPCALAVVLRVAGIIESFNVPHRGQRVVLLFVVIGMELAAGLVYWGIGAPQGLVVAQLSMTAGLGALMLGTFWTKVSAHAGLLGVVVATLVIEGGPSFLPLFVLVPVVAVARVLIDAHTPRQAIYGATVPPLVALVTGWLLWL